MTKSPTLYIDRDAFVAWSLGILLERYPSGHIVIGDRAEHSEAQRLMDSGEVIGLLVGGELFSTMALRTCASGESAYVEERCLNSVGVSPTTHALAELDL